MRILNGIADAIEAAEGDILAANKEDMEQATASHTDPNLMQRLQLKPQKLNNLCAGIRAIAKQDEPLREVWKAVMSWLTQYLLTSLHQPLRYGGIACVCSGTNWANPLFTTLCGLTSIKDWVVAERRSADLSQILL